MFNLMYTQKTYGPFNRLELTKKVSHLGSVRDCSGSLWDIRGIFGSVYCKEETQMVWARRPSYNDVGILTYEPHYVVVKEKNES